MQKLSTHQLIHHRRRVLREAELTSVTVASRRYGITRQTIYAWRKSVTPRKRGPLATVAWQTDAVTEQKIIRLRKATNYGPKRLRYECCLLGLTVGEKAIRGVILRAGLVRSHRKKRVRAKQKFYAPYPGYRVQVDTKVVPDEHPDQRKVGGRFQFTAIDIASRIRFLRIYDELSNANTIEFLKLALDFFAELGIRVECVQTDNHVTFTNVCVGGNKKAEHELRRVHPFTQVCLERGIEHKLSRPGTPRHNCFVERSHRTDDEEFYRLLDLSSLNNKKLQLEMQRW